MVRERVGVQLVSFESGTKVEVAVKGRHIRVWYFHSMDAAGVFLTQDEYGMTFYPWHRIEYMRVDDTLQGSEVR